MKKIYILLLLSSLITFGQTQIGNSIYGDGSINRLGISVAISSDGQTFASGSPITSGYVKVYILNGFNLVQKGNTLFGNGTSEYFGDSVALSSNGNILAVGASRNNSNKGCVRIYSYNGSNWVQIGTTIYGENIDDYFGENVALSSDGTILAIGGYGNDGNGTNSGHAKTYKFNGNNWVQMGSTILGDMTGDILGISVSLSSDGNILAVTAPSSDGNGEDSGLAKIYSFNGSDWIQLGNTLFGENAFDGFGRDVSLSSNGLTVAVGATYNDGNGLNSGQTRIYSFNGSDWNQIGLDIDGEASGDYFGNSVSLSSNGNVLAIGAYLNDGNGTNSGHVRIYNLIGNNWVKVGNDINGTAAGDWFGDSVALSSNGSIVCAGAPKNSSNGITESGQVRVFNLSSILSSDQFILKNFSIYPNPASEKIIITLQENLQLEKVNIYNTSGQLIKTEKNQNINVGNLAKGNYIFEVLTDKGKAAKTVLIK